MAGPLAGRTIALAEGRQLEELAEMLEKEGATALRCPMLSILDTPDAAPVLHWIHALIADRFGCVILLTGEGLRRLLGFAEREGLKDSTIAALGRTRTVTRGPKPARALKEIGLSPTLIADTPTTEGVIATLRREPLQGQTVGVQLYAENNAPLTEFLASAGAKVETVLPYVYAPQIDSQRIADLIASMRAGDIAALVFTSSPQVDRLYEVAKEEGLSDHLREGLQKTRVAAVGPIAAENLRHRGAKVDICPDRGFVMKNLVLQIVRALR